MSAEGNKSMYSYHGFKAARSNRPTKQDLDLDLYRNFITAFPTHGAIRRRR